MRMQAEQAEQPDAPKPSLLDGPQVSASLSVQNNMPQRIDEVLSGLSIVQQVSDARKLALELAIDSFPEAAAYRWLRTQIDNVIDTPYGKGLLIGKDTPANGLYIEPWRVAWYVWYGTDYVGSDHATGRFVHRVLTTRELAQHVPPEYRPVPVAE